MALDAKAHEAGCLCPENRPEEPRAGNGNANQEEKDFAIESHGSPSLKSTSDEKEHEIDVESQSNERDESIHPTAVTVPRSQRRGLLSRFAILAEVEQPVDYSRNSKWFITFVVAAAAIAAPMGSAIFFRKS